MELAASPWVAPHRSPAASTPAGRRARTRRVGPRTRRQVAASPSVVWLVTRNYRVPSCA